MILRGIVLVSVIILSVAISSVTVNERAISSESDFGKKQTRGERRAKGL